MSGQIKAPGPLGPGAGNVGPVTPLGRARWGLDQVAKISELTDDEALQARALGRNLGETQRTFLAYAQAHALVSIAESLKILAGQKDRP